MRSFRRAVSPSGRRRALLIDALGTLVALEDPVPALVAELGQRFGVAVTPAEARTAIGAEIAFYRAHLQEGRDAATLAELRGRCAAVLQAALPDRAELRARPRGEMVAVLLAALRFRAFPDAAPALAAARASGARVVVVSNWDVSLEEVLARVGLR